MAYVENSELLEFAERSGPIQDFPQKSSRSRVPRTARLALVALASASLLSLAQSVSAPGSPDAHNADPRIAEARKLLNDIYDSFISRYGALSSRENIKAFADAVQKSKPSGAKGTFIQRVAVSSTMGPGVKVEPSSLFVAN